MSDNNLHINADGGLVVFWETEYTPCKNTADSTLVFRCAACKDTGFVFSDDQHVKSQENWCYCECHVGDAKRKHSKRPE